MTADIAHPQIDVLTDERADLGEGPVIAADGTALHWVDIFAGRVLRTGLADATTTSLRVDTMVGAVALRRGGGYVAAVKAGFATIDADGTLRHRARLLGPTVRMNDAACDPLGRFWAGSTEMDFAAGGGALHVLWPDWTHRTVLTGLTQPNGLDWSPDGRTFYLVDSALGTVTAWDVDLDTARLARPRTLLKVPPSEGAPDGLSVDRDGDLWIALWGGSAVLQVAPSGRVRRRIPLPVRQPTSCAFGGPNADVLFVTSAATGIEPDPDSPDGAVLTVHGTGASGNPAPEFDG